MQSNLTFGDVGESFLCTESSNKSQACVFRLCIIWMLDVLSQNSSEHIFTSLNCSWKNKLGMMPARFSTNYFAVNVRGI